ncbi:hypothetical protein BWP03_03060 [Corynebacterium jeikeium]|nr:hypothetical protein BWP03_03060 [Corynebacterium jeikeium]
MGLNRLFEGVQKERIAVRAVDGLKAAGGYLSEGAKLRSVFRKCSEKDAREVWWAVVDMARNVPNLPLCFYNYLFLQVRRLQKFTANLLLAESGRFGTFALGLGALSPAVGLWLTWSLPGKRAREGKACPGGKIQPGELGSARKL